MRPTGALRGHRMKPTRSVARLVPNRRRKPAMHETCSLLQFQGLLADRPLFALEQP